MIGANWTWSLPLADASFKSLETGKLVFAEELIRADARLAHWEHLEKVKATPLAGGDNIYGIADFLRIADAGLRYLQPDVAKMGLRERPAGAGKTPAVGRRLPTALHRKGGRSDRRAFGGGGPAAGSACRLEVKINPLREDLCGNVLEMD